MPARRLVNLLETMFTRGMNDKQIRAYEREIRTPLKRERYKLPNRPSVPGFWKGKEDASRQAREVMQFLSSVT